MRVSINRSYRVSAYDSERNLIGSRLDNYSNLQECRSAASDLAKRVHKQLQYYSVYCIETDEYQMYNLRALPRTSNRVEFSGGFHNVGPIVMHVSDNFVSRLKDQGLSGETLDCLTEGQRRRLDRHFCGIKGCFCGAVYNNDVEWELL